jgi:hypothetical protein
VIGMDPDWSRNSICFGRADVVHCCHKVHRVGSKSVYFLGISE